MTDNFNNIRGYLDLPQENSQNNEWYYTIELIRRGKDNPGLPAANYHFKNYYIRSLHDYDKSVDEIKKICDIFKMRAYISVGQKSLIQVTLNTMSEYARRISVYDFKKPYNVFDSCSGSYTKPNSHRWVIDVDKEDWMSESDWQTYVLGLKVIINSCKSTHMVNNSNILLINPTRSGIHYITVGFNKQEYCSKLSEFRKKFTTTNEFLEKPMDTIHENHITLLYENI